MKLSRQSPKAHPKCKDKDHALKLTEDLQKKLYDLLYLMFAHDKHSLLIILQGIDTSGKDGTVRHIFAAANPQGIKVYSFKRPSIEEFRHDFIWRCHKHTPESGLCAIFNRSYYEEVTTAMVHPELLKEQHLPEQVRNQAHFFQCRYDRINDFEKLLVQKGTVIVKFFLHISKEERKHWNQYMYSFNKMLAATTTQHAPWTIVPADNKWYRDYLVSLTLVKTLQKLKMSFPKAKK